MNELNSSSAKLGLNADHPQEQSRAGGATGRPRASWLQGFCADHLITAMERTYKPTTAELAAIEKGEAALARGEILPLERVLNDLELRRYIAGAKAAKKNPGKR